MRGRGLRPDKIRTDRNLAEFIRFGIAVSALLLQVLILGCESIGSDATCGTEVADPDEMVAGCLMDESGDPAVDIAVVATLISPAAKTGAANELALIIDSVETRTNRLGRYSFKGLPEGEYYITAQDTADGTSMPPRKVTVAPDVELNKVSRSTLVSNGRIRGTLLDSVSKTPVSGATCHVPGKPFVVITDSKGEFYLDLPNDEYEVSCLGAQYVTATEKSIAVKPGKETSITLHILRVYDAEIRPPAPDQVSAVYDSTLGIIHLSWPSVEFNEPFVYYVKRIDPKNIAGYKMFSTTDTFYSDVIYPPKSDTSAAARLPKTLHYNVGTSKFGTNILSRTWARIEISNVRPPPLSGPIVDVNSVGGATEFTVGDTASIRLTVEDEAGVSASASLPFLINPLP